MKFYQLSNAFDFTLQNFMKCLIRMFDKMDKGVIFMETVVDLKYLKHTIIEVIPMPLPEYEESPVFFKEAITLADEEWSQHKKLIETGQKGIPAVNDKEPPILSYLVYSRQGIRPRH